MIEHTKLLAELNKLFLHLIRALCLCINYDKLSRIFSCTLLARNHMIFLVQFGINRSFNNLGGEGEKIENSGSSNFRIIITNM